MNDVLKEKSPISPPAVADYMTKEVITFRPDMHVLDAMEVLLRRHISGAPVVDAHGKLVGILSEKDCMRTLLHSSYYRELGGLVAEYMTKEVQTVDSATSIVTAAELFMSCNYRRFPVVDGERLVGLVSRRDILKAIQGLREE
jgi:CBS domain-containing protein